MEFYLIVPFACLWPFTILCRRAAGAAYLERRLSGRNASADGVRVATTMPLALVLLSIAGLWPPVVIAAGTTVWLAGLAAAGGVHRRGIPVAVAIPAICVPLAFVSAFYDFLAPAPDVRTVMDVTIVITFVAPSLWYIVRPLRIIPPLPPNPNESVSSRAG